MKNAKILNMNNENNTIIKNQLSIKYIMGRRKVTIHIIHTKKSCLIDGRTEINAFSALLQDGRLNEYNSC